MTSRHSIRRLAAISLLALSLASFSPAGLSLAGAAGEKDTSKNTGQAAQPDSGGNRGEQQGDNHGVKAGESHSNDDHTKADNDAKLKADNDAKTKDVGSPGCAFGNDQKNGQLATAPGCNKSDDGKAKKSDDETVKVGDATTPLGDQPASDTPLAPISVVVVPTVDQPVVATPAQPITIVVTTPIQTSSGSIPAGSTITILVGTVPLSGQVAGATISAPGVAAFNAPPFTADVLGATIQLAPDSLVAAANIPGSLPQTGGGHGESEQ